jgi:hypothetical protein
MLRILKNIRLPASLYLIPAAVAMVGCSRRGSNDAFFEVLPIVIFAAIFMGVLWIIGNSTDKRLNLGDSILTGLIVITAISVVLSLVLKIFR